MILLHYDLVAHLLGKRQSGRIAASFAVLDDGDAFVSTGLIRDQRKHLTAVSGLILVTDTIGSEKLDRLANGIDVLVVIQPVMQGDPYRKPEAQNYRFD